MSTRVSGRNKTQFPVPPEGLYQAVCADAWDIWTEDRPERWGGGIQDKTRLVWEINRINKESGRPYQVSQKYTASLHEKANLRKHLEAWRGRKFTENEIKEFELENLLGANCQLQVVHNIGSDGITYANVQAVVPLAKGMTKMHVSPDFVRKKDRKAEDERKQRSGSDSDEADTREETDDEDDSNVPF